MLKRRTGRRRHQAPGIRHQQRQWKKRPKRKRGLRWDSSVSCPSLVCGMLARFVRHLPRRRLGRGGKRKHPLTPALSPGGGEGAGRDARRGNDAATAGERRHPLTPALSPGGGEGGGGGESDDAVFGGDVVGGSGVEVVEFLLLGALGFFGVGVVGVAGGGAMWRWSIRGRTPSASRTRHLPRPISHRRRGRGEMPFERPPKSRLGDPTYL